VANDTDTVESSEQRRENQAVYMWGTRYGEVPSARRLLAGVRGGAPEQTARPFTSGMASAELRYSQEANRTTPVENMVPRMQRLDHYTFGVTGGAEREASARREGSRVALAQQAMSEGLLVSRREVERQSRVHNAALQAHESAKAAWEAEREARGGQEERARVLKAKESQLLREKREKDKLLEQAAWLNRQRAKAQRNEEKREQEAR